jgi:REP element-mobilizing transposase RayT
MLLGLSYMCITNYHCKYSEERSLCERRTVSAVADIYKGWEVSIMQVVASPDHAQILVSVTPGSLGLCCIDLLFDVADDGFVINTIEVGL